MTVTTECFKILSSMLNVCVSPWFLLFNLTPSATGTTGRDSRKTLRFYRLVWLVTSCPSLLALKYKEIVLFCALICVFRQPLRLVVLVVICYFSIAFCFLGMFLMFDFAVGWWVCVNFYLVSSFEPYRELVRLVCLVVLKCNGIVCLLMLYSKLVAIGTFLWLSCNVMLLYAIFGF